MFILAWKSLSVRTMSWSEMPGIETHCLTKDGLLVIERSRVAFKRVGSFSICSRWNWVIISRAFTQCLLFFELLLMVRDSQFMSPTLKSPPKMIVEDSLILLRCSCSIQCL